MVALIERRNVVILIIFLVVIVLVIGGVYFYNNFVNIKPLDIQKSCSKWASENEIILPTCIGRWVIDEGNCSWKCTDEEFCGSSTLASCSFDSDCKIGGCSSQVCQGVNEEGIITTCEYRDCYDSGEFGLSCGCDNLRCEWS